MKYSRYIFTTIVVISTISTATRCLNELVPLYRLYRPTTDDHLYTTSVTEASHAANYLGYIHEKSPGIVASTASHCSCGNSFKPVYRLYRSGIKDDHFYTLSESEACNAATKLGYVHEGIAFYCGMEAPICGASLPFYRYNRGTDHFYTTDENEGKENVIGVGGSLEGILCYIWPSATSVYNCQNRPDNLLPLNRLFNSKTNNHFYTASDVEANNAATNLGYKWEDSPGLVATTPLDCHFGNSFQPVYRLYQNVMCSEDHFYTLSEDEANNAVKNLGYKLEGIAYYCVTTIGKCGASLPLYRYWRGTDHFYTTDIHEGNANVIAPAHGGKYEGIICYIWAPHSTYSNFI